MKTRKTKISIAIILLIVIFITSALLTMSFVKVSFIIPISRPDNIIVYYNNETTNKVFTPNDYEYNKIYSLIVSGCKKPILTALFDNDLSNDTKVQQIGQSNIKFTNIIINFSYDKPQVVQLKNKNYLLEGQNYWYQNLIFTLSSDNKFKYNDVAIILPESSLEYSGPFAYSLKYSIYSNWQKSYNYVNTLF